MNRIKLSTNRSTRIIVEFLAIIGLGIMIYLTYIHFAQAQSFCDISESVSCDVVTTSIYSEIFGMPVSILGLIYFGLVLFLVIFNKKQELWQTIFFITLFILIPSLYLSMLELFVIKAFCILCESSKVLMLGILVISLLATQKIKKITFRMIIPIIIAGLIASGVTFFAQTGNVVKQDYTEFIECLNKQGVVYYKSFRCNNCKRQERLLGRAYQQLNSVECHPDGPNGNPELCLQKDINKTPTFLIEVNGQEINRVEGLQLLEDLAEFADCSLPVNQSTN